MTNSTPNQAQVAPLDLVALAGHTPGPWSDTELRGDRVQVCAPVPLSSCRQTVAIVEAYEARLCDEERTNARLIAAAPALLAEVVALRARVAGLERAARPILAELDAVGPADTPEVAAMMDALRAALSPVAPADSEGEGRR